MLESRLEQGRIREVEPVPEGDRVAQRNDPERLPGLHDGGLRPAKAEAVHVGPVLVIPRRQGPSTGRVDHREVVVQRHGLPVPVHAGRDLQAEAESDGDGETDEAVTPPPPGSSPWVGRHRHSGTASLHPGSGQKRV